MRNNIMLIDKKVKNNLGKEYDFQVEKLIPHSLYLVEIELYNSNYRHKSIMATMGYKDGDVWVLDKLVTLFNMGYDDKILNRDFTKIFWFKIIQEIDIAEHIKNEKIVLENYEQLQ